MDQGSTLIKGFAWETLSGAFRKDPRLNPSRGSTGTPGSGDFRTDPSTAAEVTQVASLSPIVSETLQAPLSAANNLALEEVDMRRTRERLAV